MLQIRVYGDYANCDTPVCAATSEKIKKYHVGSVDLEARMSGPNLVKDTPLQVAATLNQLQRDSELPLIVGADLERGLASRLSGPPEFPFPMAFGAVGDQRTVERFALTVAEEARAVGIHWAYAPVADVNSDPANPIINTRSFGEDPSQVAELVAAFIRGAHEGRMVVAVKHFPGEEDTSADPHVKLTKVGADLEHLARYEFPPFQSAIQAGTDSVMVAHVSVPALEADSTKIATTSSKIIEGKLRKDMGFQGVVITDALEMRGLTTLYPAEASPSGRIAVDAVKAGNDVLMLPTDVDAAFSAIVAAVRSGEIPESRIDDSVRRILKLKASLGLNKSRLVDLNRVKSVFYGKSADEFAQQISDAAVTLVRNNQKVLPLLGDSVRTTASGKLVVILFADSRLSRLGPNFERELRSRRSDVQLFHYYNDGIGSDASQEVVMTAAKAADQVVLAAFLTHATGRQIASHGRVASTVGLSGASSAFFKDILSETSDKAVMVALGSPYLIEDYQQAKTYVCTYSLVPTGEVSAVRALFGEIQNHARLPVTLPGVAAIGTALPWPQSKSR